MKSVLSILAALAIAMKSLNFSGLRAPKPTSGTPSIPHNIHHGQTRSHAPNDGRWHMKFHRNRV